MRRTAPETELTEALTLASPDLLRYLQRRLPHDDAADALAEVMMAAWRRVETLPREEEGARMWLFGIARNVVANAQRGRTRRQDLSARLKELAHLTPTEGPAADEGADVRDALARLQPDLAELVRLIHWDGFTITAAAALLSIPASTARTRYQRARAELHVALTSTVAESSLGGHARS